MRIPISSLLAITLSLALLTGCSSSDPANEQGTASGSAQKEAVAPPSASQGAALEPAQERLLRKLRRVIEDDAQPAFLSIAGEALSFEDGRLVLRATAQQVPDAFDLCDSVFSSAGGLGKLTHTQIYVDGRLAAEGIVGPDSIGECVNR